MRWDFAQLVEGIEEFQRRSQRTQKSLADGSVGGATLLGSPTPGLAGTPGVGVVGPVIPAGMLMAYFLNNGSPFLTGSYHDYNLGYSDTPDPTWFEWPAGGSDQTSVRLLSSGLYAFLALSDGVGGTGHVVQIEVGIFGTVGANSDVTTGTSKVSASGGLAVYPSSIDPSGNDVDVRVLASGPTNAQGALTIFHRPSPYYESSSGNGYAWDEVTY